MHRHREVRAVGADVRLERGADARQRRLVEAMVGEGGVHDALLELGEIPELAGCDEAALLQVTIFTGRTHQIRVHMAAVGHPVLADTLYGHTSEHIQRQALHAWRLGFTLASTGERRTFEAPVPADLQRAIETLRARHGVAARPLPSLQTSSRPSGRGGSR